MFHGMCIFTNGLMHRHLCWYRIATYLCAGVWSNRCVDPERSRAFLEEQLLPLTQFFSYIEVNDGTLLRSSALAASYGRVESPHFAMATVYEHRNIYPVFRELFSSENS